MSTFNTVAQLTKEALGFFWMRVFIDEAFVSGYVDTLSVEHADIWDATSRLPDYLSRFTIPVTESSSSRLFSFNEQDLDTTLARYGDEGLLYGQAGTAYGQNLQSFEVYRYPFDSNFCPKYMATDFTNPSKILEKDTDFFIEDGFIAFLEDPLQLDGLIRSASVDSTGSPFFRFIIWGFEVEEDIQALCNYFGTLAGVCGENSTPGLKEAVNLAWDLRIEGASVKNVHKILSIATDTLYVDKDGSVTDIFVEGDRSFVQTEDSIYSAPIGTKVLVSKGDAIKAGDIIFDTFAVYRGIHEVPAEDFDALVLGSGYLPGLTGILFSNKDVPVTNNAGFYTFPVGGSAEDVASFMSTLNSGDPSFFGLLEEKYGTVPATINPMREMQSLFIGPNSFFIKIKDAGKEARVTAQLFSVLRQTVNAGSGFFLIQQLPELMEGYDLNGVGETVGVFYSISATETGIDSNESLITSPRIF